MKSLMFLIFSICSVFSSDGSTYPKTGSFQNCTSSSPASDFFEHGSDYITVSCEPLRYRVPENLELRLEGQTLVVGVLSSADSIERRTWIRSTWAYSRQNVFFIIAGPWGKKISHEFEEYQDLIWIEKDEIYITETSTLTFKTEAFLSIVHKYLEMSNNLTVTHILKTDDDSYCDYSQIHSILHDQVENVDYWGRCFTGRKPNRNSNVPWQKKWYISYEVYPEPDYPSYCAGAGYALSTRFLDCAVAEEHIARVRYQPNEDVAIGMLAERCNVRFTNDDRVFIRWEGSPTMENKVIQHYIKDEKAMRDHHYLVTGVYGPRLKL